MTIESIGTIRYALRLLFELNESISRISKNPDRVSRALKDMRRDEVALAEFEQLVHFSEELKK